MANIKDCPGFETFGEDVRAGREAQELVCKTLAEMVNISSRYLANIDGAIKMDELHFTSISAVMVTVIPPKKGKLICPF